MCIRPVGAIADAVAGATAGTAFVAACDCTAAAAAVAGGGEAGAAVATVAATGGVTVAGGGGGCFESGSGAACTSVMAFLRLSHAFSSSPATAGVAPRSPPIGGFSALVLSLNIGTGGRCATGNRSRLDLRLVVAADWVVGSIGPDARPFLVLLESSASDSLEYQSDSAAQSPSFLAASV